MLKNRAITFLSVLAIFLCCGAMHCFFTDCLCRIGVASAAETAKPVETAPVPPEPPKVAPTPAQGPPAVQKEPSSKPVITPDQALELLAKAASDYKGTLQEHMVLQEAVDVIYKALHPTPEKK